MPWTKTAESRRQDAKRYGPAWRQARKRQLEQDSYRCQLQLDGCTYWATQVDHIHGAENDPGHRHLRSVWSPVIAR